MMKVGSIDKFPRLHLQRVVLLILLAEFIIFIISGVSFSFLNGAVFFNNGIDIFFSLFYLAGIPRFIVAHQWAGILADTTIVLSLLMLIRDPRKNKIAIFLFILLCLFYVTLMGYINHRNFHIGFVVVLFPFLFQKLRSRYFAYEATRYFILFFYASAAIFKLTFNSLAHTDHLSTGVMGQFAPYFVEGNTGLRTEFNLFIIRHTTVGFVLMILSFIAELVAVTGFFTKRFDKLIGISVLVFHLVNWFLMDIAPFGQIAFISLLFISKAFPERE